MNFRSSNGLYASQEQYDKSRPSSSDSEPNNAAPQDPPVSAKGSVQYGDSPAVAAPSSPSDGTPIEEYVAEQERDPVRKAALDKARAELHSEKSQPSPTWEELDAIRKGKSDIDLAERIWQIERKLAEAEAELERRQAKIMAAQSATTAIPEGCTPTDAMVLREANGKLAEENHNLRRCLRWYANGEHIVGFDGWEGPSGDDNWLCPPSADTGLPSIDARREQFIETLDQNMIEDGSVARATLVSAQFNVESPEDEPKVIRGEPEWHIEQAAVDGGAKREGR